MTFRKTMIARKLKFAIAASAIVFTGGQASAGTPPAPAAVKQMNVNGAALIYQEQGQGSPVLFLHGAIGDYRNWEGEREAIAAGHHFIALTMRYFGTAAWPTVVSNSSAGSGRA